MTLAGTPQIETSVVINATVDAVWAVLSDARLLPKWVPAVDQVTACSDAGEAVGTTRSCVAKLGSKTGTMVERCVEYSPTRRIAFVVDDESFGMQKMFDHYGFSLDLRERGAAKTEVVLRTHYTPRNRLYAAMNALMMQRKFRVVCTGIVGGLKSFTESRAAVANEERSRGS